MIIISKLFKLIQRILFKSSELKITYNFIFFGTINTLLTNIFLQILINIYPLWVSTFLSQFLNLIIGFFSYSFFVYKVKKIFFKQFIKFLILSIFSWNLNTFLILIMNDLLNINLRLAALLGLPLIATFSFISQKKFIYYK